MAATLAPSLNPIGSGKGVINPGPAPSSLGSLAETASNLLGTVSNLKVLARRKVVEDRQDIQWIQQQEEYQHQKSKDVVYDQLAEGVFGILKDDSTVIPKDVVASTDSAVAAQRGATQGRLPQATADLKIEALVADVSQKYPDQQDEIFSWLQGRGLDHVVFRAKRAEIEQAATSDAAVIAGQKAAYEYAIKNGFNPTTGSYEKGVAFGADLAMSKAQYDQRKDALSLQETQLNISEKQRSQLKVEHSDNLFGYLQSDAQHKLSYAVDNFSTLINEAGSDPTKVADLEKISGQANAFFETYRQNGYEIIAKQNGTKEDKDAFDKMVDSYKESFTTLYSGELSQMKANTNALNVITTKWKLDAATAMPLYSQMVNQFGQNTANNLLGSDIITEDQVSAIRSELKGVKFGTPDGSIALMNIGAVLKGEKNIHDLKTPKEREQALKVANTSINANVDKAFNGDPSATHEFARGYSVGLNAAVDINPATAARNDIIGASKMFFDPRKRTVLEKMLTNSSTANQAQEIIIGSRAAAARILDAAKSPALMTKGYQYLKLGPDGHYSVVYDEKKVLAAYKRGAFDVTSPDNTDMGGSHTFSTTTPTADEVLKSVRQIDSELQQEANAMNSAVDHLVATDKHSPAAPKGLSELEARRFWNTGQLPTGPDGKSKVEAPLSPQDWSNRLGEFSNYLGNATVSNVEEHVAIPTTEGASTVLSAMREAAQGSNTQVTDIALSGIVGNLQAESGFNTGATSRHDGSDASDSIGLAQWNSTRATALKAYANSQGTDWTDLNTQAEFLMKELAKDHPGVLKKLNAAKTPDEAANIFAKYFLRPSGSDKSGFDNIHNINERRANARSFFTK